MQAGSSKNLIYVANIQLCRAVKEFPCIYDFSQVDYIHPDEQNKIWEDIAKKCNNSVKNCKKRWIRILRYFVQYIKQRLPPHTNYYLADELNFLKPHAKYLKRLESISFDYDDEYEEDEEELIFSMDRKANNILMQQRKRATSVKQDSSVPEKKSKTEVEQVGNELTPGRRSKRLSTRMARKQLQSDDDDAPLATFSNKTSDKTSTTDEKQKHNEHASEQLKHVAEGNPTAALTEKPKKLEPIVKLIRAKSPFQATTPEKAIETLPAAPLVATTKTEQLADNNNGDDDFWKLIKPQMDALNARQKLHFKKKVFQSLIEVLDDGSNFPGSNEQLPNVKPMSSIINETTEEMRLIRELVCLVQAAKNTPELMNDNNASVQAKAAVSKDVAIAPTVDNKQPIAAAETPNLAPVYRVNNDTNILNSAPIITNRAGQLIRRFVKVDKQNRVVPAHVDATGRRIYRLLPKTNVNATNALTPSTISIPKITNDKTTIGTFIVPHPRTALKSTIVSKASTLASTTTSPTINMANQRLPTLPTNSLVSVGSSVVTGGFYNVQGNLRRAARNSSTTDPHALKKTDASKSTDAASASSQSLPKKVVVGNAVPAFTSIPATTASAITNKTAQKISVGMPISTHFVTATLPIGGYGQFIGTAKSVRKSLPTNSTNNIANLNSTAINKLAKPPKDPLSSPALSNETIAKIKKVVDTKKRLPAGSNAAATGIIDLDDFDTGKIKTEITDDQ